MASLTLITVSVLAILVQTCKGEIPGLHHPLEQEALLANYHGPVVYVPEHEEGLQLQNLQHHLHQYGGASGVHQQRLGSAAVHQLITQHGAEQRHTVHHHGSGVSHQAVTQDHQHVQHGLESEQSEDYLHKKDHNVNYKFEYSVNDHKTGDVKLHREERKGDVVNGEYSLLEEDGNVRTVKYYADWKTGFHAEVHNSKPKSVG
ncbi:Chitin bind 4 domain containing protein [Asbolus verrucosus]|uniref:Chitin bind 4 domain containing protein n=1 Tax=Asbolus verrucosus TaxID=1661398 RepID=A0A482VT15_ASBVE|nr:Chitin bind 4 domain containing protein [Asbolus verrucosus]